MAVNCQTDLSRGVIIVSGHGDNSGDPATAGVHDACWVHQPCIADSGQLRLAGETHKGDFVQWFGSDRA